MKVQVNSLLNLAGASGLSVTTLTCPLDGYLTYLAIGGIPIPGGGAANDISMCWIAETQLTVFSITATVFPMQIYLTLDVGMTSAVTNTTTSSSLRSERNMKIRMGRNQTLTMQAVAFITASNNIIYRGYAEFSND